MCSLNKKMQIDISNDINTKMHYYTRGMKGFKYYESHIFIIMWDSEEMLEKHWKRVDALVAFKFQSNNEEEIERSNYYICHALSNRISVELKRTIEQNTFCAKKYVFEKCNLNIKTICSIIEKKIFDISLPDQNSSGKVKLAKIELKNFRGYQGKAEFNLLDKQKNPASFVAVFAPNGLGKTSLFDSIEYALKGEVEYLKEVAKNSKFNNGVIYRNKENQLEEAYVRLVLEDGNEIIRTVGNLDENGTDLRIVTPREGKDIVGLRAVSSKWNRIILPYARLESFITAKNPEDRYDEWFNNAPELSDERILFEKKNDELKELEKSLIDTDTEYKKNEKKVDDLQKYEDSINTIEKLIKEYNLLNIYEKLPKLSIASNEDDLNTLLNTTDVLKRRLQSEKEQLSKSIEEYDEYEGLGFDNCKTLYFKLTDIMQKVEDYKKLLHDKGELARLLQERSIISNQAKTINRELEIYENIKALGKEKLIVIAKNYANLYDTENGINKSIEILKKDLETVEIQIVSTENKINECERLLETQKGDCDIIRKIEELKIQNARIEDNIYKNKKSIDSILKQIDDYHYELAENIEIEIPDSIANWDKSNSKNWNRILNNQLLTSIDELYEEYLLISSQINETENKKSKSIQLLNSINELGKQFQDLNSSNCNCPLCSSAFEAPKVLYARILNCSREIALDSDLETLNEKRARIKRESQSRIKLLKEEKSLSEKIIRGNINEAYEKVNSLKKETMELEDIISNNNRIKENEQKQITNSELINVESLNEANDFFDNNWMLYDRLNQSKSNLLNQQSELKRNIIDAQTELDEILGELKGFYNNPSQIDYISFLRGINYDFDNNYKALLKKIAENEAKNDDNSKELLQYKSIIDNNLTDEYIQKQIKNLEKNLKPHGDFYKRFKKYAYINSYQFSKMKEEAINTLNINLQATELLNQIYEENGIREYLRSYRETCKRIRTLTIRKNSLIIRIDETKKELDEIQGDLEKKFGQYYGVKAMNEIYQKIDPHEDMKSLSYHLSFNDQNNGELYFTVNENESNSEDAIRPEIYFSTAQLNTVALSSFLGRALDEYKDLALNSIFIDDPIGSFDDMNVLGFADLIRSIIEKSKHQIMISTHDEKVFRILKRKLNEDFHSSCFLVLPQSDNKK